MKPAPFDYLVPDSLAAAVDIMAENGYDAKILAGGQSLIPAMNFRLVQPALLMDLNRLTELDYVRQADDGGLRIGALVRHSRLEKDPLVARRAPLIHQTMPHVAHIQIRNRGTLGGTLAHADPAGELPVIMVALEARFQIQGRQGNRWVEAADFFQSLFITSLEPEEILTEVAVPPLPERTGTAFVEFARRAGDYALLGVAAVLTLDEAGICRDARLVYLNAGEIPTAAHEAAAMLIGQQPTAELFKAAADHAAEKEIDPSGDIHASEAYLRHLGRVLTVRALTNCQLSIVN